MNTTQCSEWPTTVVFQMWW